MGKLLAADIYNALSGAVPWVPAPYPCYVVDYWNDTTVAKCEVVREIHNLAKNKAHIECNVDKWLVKTLIEAVREDNCSPLNNSLIWFANVTLAMVFNHLNTTLVRKLKKYILLNTPRCKRSTICQVLQSNHYILSKKKLTNFWMVLNKKFLILSFYNPSSQQIQLSQQGSSEMETTPYCWKIVTEMWTFLRHTHKEELGE